GPPDPPGPARGSSRSCVDPAPSRSVPPRIWVIGAAREYAREVGPSQLDTRAGSRGPPARVISGGVYRDGASATTTPAVVAPAGVEYGEPGNWVTVPPSTANAA